VRRRTYLTRVGRLTGSLALICLGGALLANASSPAQAALRRHTSVCRAGDGFPDPSAEIVSVGPSCRRAKHVFHDFFAKAQAHGVPVTVDRFRCDVIVHSRNLPGVPVCRHRRAKIEYYGHF
jgi:hypothetical protein